MNLKISHSIGNVTHTFDYDPDTMPQQSVIMHENDFSEANKIDDYESPTGRRYADPPLYRNVQKVIATYYYVPCPICSAENIVH